jgi:hypothetical protein
MRALTLVLALAACHHGAMPPAGAGSPAGRDTVVAGFEDADKARLEDVIRDARASVSSAAFHQALAEIDSLRVTAGRRTMSGAEVDEIYAGQSSAASAIPVRYEPASLWRRLTASETAVTGLARDAATTALHPIVLTRISGSLEARACAINTLAHEWTHAIREQASMLFTDAGYRNVRNAIVSYTVGAVAQCVYLARARPLLDVRACIQAAGTHSFEQCTCSPGWVEAFIAGDTTCKRTD